MTPCTQLTCRHFLSFFSGPQRILGYVRPRRITEVHPPEMGKRNIWRRRQTVLWYNWPSNAPPKYADPELGHNLWHGLALSQSWSAEKCSEGCSVQCTEAVTASGSTPGLGSFAVCLMSSSCRLFICTYNKTVLSPPQKKGCCSLRVRVNPSKAASFTGAFEGQLHHNAARRLSQIEGSSRCSFSLYLASHIPRFFVGLTKKKEKERKWRHCVA